MKRNFTILISVFSCLFALNCKPASAPETNVSQAVVVDNAATPNENTAATKMPEQVPIFTDANEAAAAGDKYLDEVETENAIDAFRQAVKINPDFGDAYFKLGIAYSLREKESVSAGETETSAEPTPKPSSKKAKKAKKDAPPVPVTDAEKAFDKAAKAYEKDLKKNPKDDLALYNLGRAYNKLNRDKESEKALRQAAKLQPENVDYLIEFGSILMKLAQYDEAVTVLNKAVKFDDSNIQAQDLLEKADAGKKRINFGIEPKPPQKQQQETSNAKPPKLSKPKPSASASPNAVPPPPPLLKPTPKAAPTKKTL